MSEEREEEECPECPPGLPAYLATFADLMSLLMCFFVLLLAFSEMDVMKYKQLAGSMRDAFGVQNKIDVKDIPKGTSVIAQEFSPGRPEPTVLNEVRQHTDEITQKNLQILCTPGNTPADTQNSPETDAEAAARIMQQLIRQTQADAVEAAQSLKAEIKEGKIEVETKGRKIIIRVKEQGSFASGSATLRPSFMPVMDKIRNVLKEMRGSFAVTGHTDDVPISTPRFRSNWELSSSRAVSVAHELMKTGEIAPDLFSVVGLGETEPLAPNDTDENRARNRRVEIVVEQGKQDDKILSGEEALPEDDEFTPEMIKEAGLEGLKGFEIYDDDGQGNQRTLKSDEDGGDGEKVISVFDPPPPPEAPLSPLERDMAELPAGDEFDAGALDDPGESLDIDVDESPEAEAVFPDGPPGQPAPGETSQPREEATPDSVRGQSGFDMTQDPFATEPDPAEDEFF
ncbi:MAG: flagellar motor protein MotB [Ketobacteraceae bacterium]|nr:flagellar motor protein MotB [Ketobacteraceae bacterium]